MPSSSPRSLAVAGIAAAAGFCAAGALVAQPTYAETTTSPTTATEGVPGAPGSSGAGTGPATNGAPTTGPARLWGFFQLVDGAWVRRPGAPSDVVPDDGAVEGWRYSASDLSAPRPPRNSPSFDDVCGKVAAEAGRKRVGVVIDYGRKADARDGATPPAPLARCASVPAGASSEQVLAGVASPRADQGRICAIDNYPGGDACRETLASLSAEAQAPDDKVDITVKSPNEQLKPAAAPGPQASTSTSQGPSKKLLTGIAAGVVAVVGGIAYLVRRRRKVAA